MLKYGVYGAFSVHENEGYFSLERILRGVSLLNSMVSRLTVFATGVAIGVLAGVALWFILSGDARTLATSFAVSCAALFIIVVLWWNYEANEPDD